MPRNSYGQRVVVWRRGWSRCRVRQWLPRFRVTLIQVVCPRRWYVVQWSPRVGWLLVSSGPTGTPVHEPDYNVSFEERKMKRRQPPLEGGEYIAPALSMTSTILSKLPALREFITATSYEDGTARVPGYFTLRNRGASFEITVYDYDSGCRMAVTAPELDKALLLLETMLGVADAPWEQDRWLMEQLVKRNKGKKK